MLVRGGAEPLPPGVEHVPRTSELGEHPGAPRRGHLAGPLEGGAGLQQPRAQRVRASRPVFLHLGDLGRHYPSAVERGIALRHRAQRLRHAERHAGDDLRILGIGFGYAGKALRKLALGRSGQVGDGPPRRAGAPDRERADVAALVDDHERVVRAFGDDLVEAGLGVGDAPAQQNRSCGVDGVGPMGLLADVEL